MNFFKFNEIKNMEKSLHFQGINNSNTLICIYV
jgi:hypothetical protein